MEPLSPEVARALIGLLGPQRVLTEHGALLAYESDALTTRAALPTAVVFPEDTAEVAAVVTLLSGASVPFVPRGAGTGLSGGAVPLSGAVIISLTRMKKILSIDFASARARVQPGVVNAELAAAVAREGLHYAPDPSSQGVCTLGGNVAENAGGPHCLKYGATVNHVTALTVVLPDGEVVELGGDHESVLDLVGLFIGSEGTFGIATEIEVRLTPLPEASVTLLAVYDSASAAARTVNAFIEAGLLPAALEMLDGKALDALEKSSYAAGYPVDARAVLVIDLDGARAALPRLTLRAEEVCRGQGAREVRRAEDEAGRARLWAGRKNVYAVVARLAPDILVQDAVVPRSRLPEVLEQITDIAARSGLQIVTVAHLGDGNLHPNLLFDRRDADQLQRVEAAAKEILVACVAAGGSITGEHGVGLDKRESLGMMFGDGELSAMCAVREAFNPRGILNPGKVLPLRSCREWAPPKAGGRDA